MTGPNPQPRLRILHPLHETCMLAMVDRRSSDHDFARVCRAKIESWNKLDDLTPGEKEYLAEMEEWLESYNRDFEFE